MRRKDGRKEGADMKKKKRKHPELNKNCYNCNHCQYIGEGGYVCDMSNDVVIDE
jgi:hypothetical protein